MLVVFGMQNVRIHTSIQKQTHNHIDRVNDFQLVFSWHKIGIFWILNMTLFIRLFGWFDPCVIGTHYSCFCWCCFLRLSLTCSVCYNSHFFFWFAPTKLLLFQGNLSQWINDQVCAWCRGTIHAPLNSIYALQFNMIRRSNCRFFFLRCPANPLSMSVAKHILIYFGFF